MSRLNVLFVTTWCPTPENPVQGTFVVEHAKAVSLRHHVVILHLDRGYVHGLRRPYLAHETTEQGLRVVHVRYGRFPVPKSRRFNFAATALLAARKLAREGFRPHVVHANVYLSGVPAVWIGRWFRVPVVLSEHFSGVSQRRLGPRQRREARSVYRNLDRGLPVCRPLGEAMLEHGLRGPYTVVPNGAETRLFHPGADAPRAAPPRFLCVNILSPVKGVPHLLAAAAALRDRGRAFGLDVVGDGPELDAYRESARALGLDGTVVFHGRLHKREIADLMRRSHALVLASLSENLPCVIVEALLCGLPVVATAVGGVPELVDAENGFLVPPADEPALTDALDRMLAEGAGFGRAAIAGRAAARYSLEAVSARFDAVYRDAIAGRARA